MNHGSVTFTGSLNGSRCSESTATPVAPWAGTVDCTAGAESVGVAIPVIEMSSKPTHSSEPTASVVMART